MYVCLYIYIYIYTHVHKLITRPLSAPPAASWCWGSSRARRCASTASRPGYTMYAYTHVTYIYIYIYLHYFIIISSSLIIIIIAIVIIIIIDDVPVLRAGLGRQQYMCIYIYNKHTSNARN